MQKASPNWFEETHERKRKPSGDNQRKERNDSGDANNDQCDSGYSGDQMLESLKIDKLVAHSSMFPFEMDDDGRYDFDEPIDLHGDVRPKSNSTRNDVSPSVNSESPTLPVSQRSMGQQAASAPPSWRPEPSVHSYHPSLATSNATYSSSQPQSLPRSGNPSMRSSRGRNSSGGSRASSNHSNAPMLRNDAAAPPFGDLGSFQGDSAHPSSDFGMRSLREEEEFPSIPDVINVSKVLTAVCLHVTFLTPSPLLPPLLPCGKVMFSQACVKNSVHRGVTGADTPHLPNACWDTPPWADTPPSHTHHCSGQYASYWNAFLLDVFFSLSLE